MIFCMVGYFTQTYWKNGEIQMRTIMMENSKTLFQFFNLSSKEVPGLINLITLFYRGFPRALSSTIN